jgi:hypothetical protein
MCRMIELLIKLAMEAALASSDQKMVTPRSPPLPGQTLREAKVLRRPDANDRHHIHQHERTGIF